MAFINSRIEKKIVKGFSKYFDSYSLYFNMAPRSVVSRLSDYAMIGNNVQIGRIISPSPEYLEIRDDVSISELNISQDKYLFIERGGVYDKVFVNQHTVLSNNNMYSGDEIERRLITISIDVEAAVALSHVNQELWKNMSGLWNTKYNVIKLAELFKKYSIPVTWAICGHLFLKECNCDHDINEQDWFGPWFDHDPCTDYKKDPSWYMPDVIECLATEDLFEIAYHSFGHYRYQKCSLSTIEKDIEMAKKIRDEWGLSLQSMVFPYNQCGYFEHLIERGGFHYFRGNIGNIYPSHGAIDFEKFIYFNTTYMFSPETMDICENSLIHQGSKVVNYYTHCYQWPVEMEWNSLESWIRRLVKLRDDNEIEIVQLCRVNEKDASDKFRSGMVT